MHGPIRAISITHLVTNTVEVLAEVAAVRAPLVITQNGVAKAVLQDPATFEETREALALLKVLALGNRDLEAGRVRSATKVIARLRAKRG
jgi:prevent-host-death family protein